nr:unnamed protein product [Digitaria exilis]
MGTISSTQELAGDFAGDLVGASSEHHAVELPLHNAILRLELEEGAPKFLLPPPFLTSSKLKQEAPSPSPNHRSTPT